MIVIVNGRSVETGAGSLAALVGDLHPDAGRVATAVNGRFVRAGERSETGISNGDQIEIVSARQGG